MKTCAKCKMEKPETDFYFRRSDSGKRRNACKVCGYAQQKVLNRENPDKLVAYNKNYYVENRDKIAAKAKIYRAKNREKIAVQNKIYWLGSKYGLTPGDFKRMLAEQGGVCAICGGLEGKKDLCVDHDHETGKVRSLLCQGCNQGIGNFKDSSTVAQLATNYLKKHGK